MRLTRRYRFCASHRLHSTQLPDEENARIYGKCNNPFGHGHNYAIDVCVRGPMDPATGRVVDLRILDRLMQANILGAFDHQDLNSLPAFSDTVPTSENLGLEIYRRLAAGWREAFPAGAPALDRVRVEETERNIFEIGTKQKEEG
jgi:6-pyruvoyltetrahydropterin/6-carboxytetrahydropterin synthase